MARAARGTARHGASCNSTGLFASAWKHGYSAKQTEGKGASSAMVVRLRVGSRYQIAVPAEARQRLKISRGDYMLVEVRDGTILLRPEPENYADHLRGLHREVWEGLDAQEYVNRERDAWQG